MINNHRELIIGKKENFFFSKLQSMYRYGDKYRINGTDYRTLSKIYGLRFVIAITGLGGQFYIVNLFVAIGKNNRLKYFSKNSLLQVPVLVLW
jgi:hypothetical protein